MSRAPLRRRSNHELEAMKPDAPLLLENLRTKDMFGKVVADTPSNVAAQHELGRGDVEEGLAEADVVVEGSYTVGIAHQGYIELTELSMTTCGDSRSRLIHMITTELPDLRMSNCL